jgi:hypothetical protein
MDRDAGHHKGQKMNDWSELTIKQEKLTKQIAAELNEQNYKDAFATSVKMVSVSIKLQQWTFERLPK